MNRLLNVASFLHVKDNEPNQETPRTWKELCARLSHHRERASKEGVGLWSPVQYRAGDGRGKEGVLWVECFVIDFDNGETKHDPSPLPNHFAARWAGLEVFIHTTHRHTDEKPRWRAILPLAAPVPADAWPATWNKLMYHLADGLGDPLVKDCSRLFYLPSHPPDAPYFATRIEGAWLDPDAYPDPPPLPKPKLATMGRLPVQDQPEDIRERLLARALQIAGSDSRHSGCLWLMRQCHDNRLESHEALALGEQYVALCGGVNSAGEEEEFPPSEMAGCLEWGYSQPQREPWKPRTWEEVRPLPEPPPEPKYAAPAEVMAWESEERGAAIGYDDAYAPPNGSLGRKHGANGGTPNRAHFVPENGLFSGLERKWRKGRRGRGEIYKPPSWPAPLADEAFFGLAGDFVHTIESQTEADPAALLLSFLTSAGNLLGLGPHMRVGPKVHRLREFVALVGETNSGRKGTSVDFSRDLMKLVDPSWQYTGGLSSGEGLIWKVHDEVTKQIPIKDKGIITGYQQEVVEPNITDKRLLVIEEEFANVLRVAAREGNTLSAILRQFWDSDTLQSLTKNSPAKATGAHISCIVHITPLELRRNLNEIEVANGFANRFLWACSMRSRFLPHGGNQINLQPFADQLSELRNLPHMHACEMKRDKQANAIWEAVYPHLADDQPGMLGAVTARAEAHCLRLSGMYAALDGGHEIRRPHLLAALAVWDYCMASAQFIFGSGVGEPVADLLMDALRDAAPEGLSRTEIREAVFQRNVASEKIEEAVAHLEEVGLVVVEKEATGKRPRTMVYATGGLRGRPAGILRIAKEAAGEMAVHEGLRL